MSLVSAIIPNYNHAPFLRQRIDSVLAQTAGLLEIILLDDASTDGSRDILNAYRGSERVTGVRFNERNSGSPFAQWNAGARLARGEFLWFAESDDAAEPRLLERLLDVMTAHPNVGLAYAQSRLVDAVGREAGTLDGHYAELGAERWHADFVNDGRDERVRYLAIKNTIPNASAVIVRRSAFDAAGGADESYRVCGDWMLWAGVLRARDVGFVSEPLNAFRVHARTAREANKHHLLVERVRPIIHIAETSDLTGLERKRLIAGFCKYWVWMAASGLLTPSLHRELLSHARRLDQDIEWRLLGAVAAAASDRVRRRFTARRRTPSSSS